MKNPEVMTIRTREPLSGNRRKIVFSNGKYEHVATIRAPMDWEVRMAIDEEGDIPKFYCVCISPEGDEVGVERWTADKAPSKIMVTGADVTARFGTPLETSTNDIVEEVRDELD